MNDDELLRRLAEAAREEERAERDRLDPRWEELAAGRLSEEDEAALRREAEESMETRRALEAFTPLGTDFRARVMRDAREEISAARATVDRDEATGAAAFGGAAHADEIGNGSPSAEAPSTPSTSRSSAPTPGGPEPDERPSRARTPDQRIAGESAQAEQAARPFRLPERTRSRSQWAAAAVLAAAVLAVVLWPEAEPLPLPDYRTVLEGAVRTERGPDPADESGTWPEPAVFAAGNRFELLLRPEIAVEGAVEVRTFRQRDRSLVPWPLPAETAEGGAVRIAGTVGREIALPAGESTLVVVLARRSALPPADEVLAGLGESARASGERWWAGRWRLSRQAAEP